MAWIFSLSAECGTDKRCAEAVAAHFDGYVATLDDGRQLPCPAGVSSIEGAWWAICCPEGVTRTGINSSDDERVLTSLSFQLYDHLHSSPPFRYAIAGVEVDGFRNYDELDNDIIDMDFTGLVISEEIWLDHGSPSIFIPFATGYRWRPFIRAR